MASVSCRGPGVASVALALAVVVWAVMGGEVEGLAENLTHPAEWNDLSWGGEDIMSSRDVFDRNFKTSYRRHKKSRINRIPSFSHNATKWRIEGKSLLYNLSH